MKAQSFRHVQGSIPSRSTAPAAYAALQLVKVVDTAMQLFNPTKYIAPPEFSVLDLGAEQLVKEQDVRLIETLFDVPLQKRAPPVVVLEMSLNVQEVKV